ncbi:DUF2730 family protein [Streptosporangium amethystogenes]|uniref:DUF2730 family protein n=1 Tax=Streptosporangium amethystogenes TaxID=2002 RepID=UPI0004CC6129|nr:DUF2730 family protein [Streptosporangium amethystogenes]
MPGVAIGNTGQRLTELEAHAFKTSADLAYIKETLNDLPKIVREEVMTYTAPMFEEIMNRMATKEALSALSTKVDGLDIKVDSLDIKVDGLETKVDGLDARMGSMEGRMDSMESNMSSMNARMDSMEGKLDLILAKLN